MEEGEPILGGPQVTSGNTATSNVGPRPINPAVPTASSTDFSSFQSGTQSSVPPISTPIQSIPSARPQSVPRLTNRFSDRAALNQTPRTPIINNTPQNTQFVQPAPQVDSYASDIISYPTPTQPKKSKRWIAIVLVLLVLTGISVGAVMFVPTLLTGPVQEVSEEELNELTTAIYGLNDVYSMIDDGIQSKINFYELFLTDYLRNNKPELYNVISSKKNLTKYHINDILGNTSKHISNLKNTIEAMSQNNYSRDVNEKIHEIQATLPEYNDIMTSFLDKISKLKSSFSGGDPEAIKDVINDKETLFFIERSYENYKNALTNWNNCVSNMETSECVARVDELGVVKMTDDTVSIRELFNTLLNEENVSTIQTIYYNTGQLLDLIKGKTDEE